LNTPIRWQDDVTRPERMRSLPASQQAAFVNNISMERRLSNNIVQRHPL